MGITMSQLVASTKRESGHIHTHTHKKEDTRTLRKTHSGQDTQPKQNTR